MSRGDEIWRDIERLVSREQDDSDIDSDTDAHIIEPVDDPTDATVAGHDQDDDPAGNSVVDHVDDPTDTHDIDTPDEEGEPKAIGAAVRLRHRLSDEGSDEAPQDTNEARLSLSSSTRKRIVIGLVALVALAAIVTAVSRSGSAKTTGSTASGSRVLLNAGDTAEVEGRTWTAVQGDWSADQGVLKIEQPGNLNASMIVTDGGASDITVQAKMSVVASGAGLVFRYQDPFNYWALKAARSVASWQLVMVVKGITQVVGDTGLSPTQDGTVVLIDTRANGAIAITFNGKNARLFSDATLADKRAVGLLAYGQPAAKGQFSDFRTSSVLAAPLDTNTTTESSSTEKTSSKN